MIYVIKRNNCVVKFMVGKYQLIADPLSRLKIKARKEITGPDLSWIKDWNNIENAVKGSDSRTPSEIVRVNDNQQHTEEPHVQIEGQEIKCFCNNKENHEPCAINPETIEQHCVKIN